jgi:hypothetical protein
MKIWILGIIILFFPLVIHSQELMPYIPQIDQIQHPVVVTKTVNELSSYLLQPSAEEFPLWAKDLRRAEIITFGSLPFTMFFSLLTADTIFWASHDWDTSYAPWPIRSAGAVEMSVDDRLITLGVALGVSLLIATADHIIVRVKRSNEAKKAAALPVGEPIIIRRPLDDFPEKEENQTDNSGNEEK